MATKKSTPNNKNDSNGKFEREVRSIKKRLEKAERTSNQNLYMNFGVLAVAILSLYFSYRDTQTNQANLADQRPYLAFQNPYIIKINDNTYQVTAQMENMGQRVVAPGFKINFYTIWQDSNGGLNDYSQKIPFANSYPPGIRNEYQSPQITLNDSQKFPNFLAIETEYSDQILNISYSDIYFYNWKENGPLEYLNSYQNAEDLKKYLNTKNSKT